MSRRSAVCFGVAILAVGVSSVGAAADRTVAPAYALIVDGRLPIAEPYPSLNGGDFTGPAVPESPDPLVRYRWRDPSAAAGFQVYLLRPVAATSDSPAAFDDVTSATTERCQVAVRGEGSIRFDFGVESAAWLEFDSPDFSGGVEMSISEYNEPAVVNIEAERPVKTLPPKRYGNTFRLELNRELYEGVRFGWIHVRRFQKPWHITAARLVCRAKPANYNGSFSCSDPLLTRTWYTAAYTVKVNLLIDGLGSILIDRSDRVMWTVECGSSLPAALTVFGNWDLLRTQLINTRGNANGIEVNVLHWIIGLLKYYWYTGDTATLEQLTPDVVAKLDHADAIYSDPKMSWFAWDERGGAGFENPNLTEAKNGYRMTFIRVCREFACVMDALGRTELRDKYRDMADRRVAELRKDPRWLERLGIFAGGGALTAGIPTVKEQRDIFAREFSDRVNRLTNCPFDVYYSLQALARMGHYDTAVAMVRDHWGGQLDYGATMLLETYRPEWNRLLGRNDPVPSGPCGYTSLAHPWGSGVASWMTEELLGIKPAAAGFSKINILPHLGRTLTWVAGSVPTPRGTVAARFDVQSGKCELTIPPGSMAHVGIPAVERAIKNVSVNGRLVWDGQPHPAEGIEGATADAEFVYLAGVPPGKYVISVVYNGTTPAFTDVPFGYPIRFVNEDAETHGNWGGRYGRDGHVLFNYDGVGKDRRRLPAYIWAVTNRVPPFAKPVNLQMAAGVSDRRAPSPDAANSSPRNVGCLHTDYSGWADTTMTVDVAAKAKSKYRLALYVVDWNNRGQQEVVEVFDLATLRLVAPIRLVRDFAEGKYLTYECDRPVRLRINQVRNGNPILNGLFFDPVP